MGSTIMRNQQEQWRHEVIRLIDQSVSFVLMDYGSRQRIRVSAEGLVLIDSNPVNWRERIFAVAVSIGRQVIADDENVVLEEFGG